MMYGFFVCLFAKIVNSGQKYNDQVIVLFKRIRKFKLQSDLEQDDDDVEDDAFEEERENEK